MWQCVNWIHVAQTWSIWGVFVNRVKNIVSLKNTGKFFTVQLTLSYLLKMNSMLWKYLSFCWIVFSFDLVYLLLYVCSFLVDLPRVCDGLSYLTYTVFFSDVQW